MFKVTEGVRPLKRDGWRPLIGPTGSWTLGGLRHTPLTNTVKTSQKAPAQRGHDLA